MPGVWKTLSAVAMIVAMLGGCMSDDAERAAPPGAPQPTKPGETEAAAAARQALAEEARAGAVAGNLLQNGSFETWSEGGSTLPAGWRAVETETPPKTSRISDPVHDGKSAVRIVSDRGVVSIASEGPAITDAEHADLRGKLVVAGVWVKADTPNAAFINIRDGIDESRVVDHPGDGTWQFLTVSYVLSPNAKQAAVRIGNRKQDGEAVAIFDDAVLVAAK